MNITTSHTPILTIANPKGRSGKTTSVVNLAVELGRTGWSTLVVDLDPQAMASTHLGLKHPSERLSGVYSLLIGSLETAVSYVQARTRFQGVSLLSAGLELEHVEDELRARSLRPLEELSFKLSTLASAYDFVLIDTPPSLRFLTSAALIASEHLIVPVDVCDVYALHGLSKLTELIEQVRFINPSLSVLGGLLTRYDKRQTVCKMIEGAATAQLGALLPVQVASSCKVQESFDRRLSMNEHDRTCKVSRAYIELATHLAQRFIPKALEDTVSLLSASSKIGVSKIEVNAQEGLF